MKVCLSAILCLLSLLAQTPRHFGRGVWRGEVVDYRVVDGWAVFDGDIIIGRADVLEERFRQFMAAPSEPARWKLRESIAVADKMRLWTNGIVPYEIDPTIGDAAGILSAIDHWNTRTPLKLQPRNGEFNFIRFAPYSDPSVCASSSIGMQSGQQYVFGSSVCSANLMIHEIGHAIGLDHEMARSDRDQYIRVLWENISPFARSQYTARPGEADFGPYDYNSMMHYGVPDFGQRGPGMSTIPPGIPIRQNTVLSEGDLDAVNRLYGQIPSSVTLATTPSGLSVIVDGETVVTPRSFSFAEGTVHTLEAPAQQSDDRGRYEFARWSDGGARAHAFTAGTSTTLLMANFVRYNRFAFHASPEGAGTVTVTTPSDDGTYRDGTPISILATPADGWKFAGWTGAFFDLNGLKNFSRNPLNVYAHSQYQDMTAVFTQSPVTRFANVLTSGGGAGAILTVDGTDYSMPATFLWDAGSVHEVSVADSFPVGSDATLRVFQKWNDDGPRQRKVTAGAEDASFTATFQSKYGFGVIWNGGGQMAMSPTSPDGYYDENSQVTLTATGTGSIQFIGWGGDLWGTDNPFTISLTQTVLAFGFFMPSNAVSVVSVGDAARNRITASVSGNQFVASVAPGQAATVKLPGITPTSTGDTAADSTGRYPTIAGGLRVLFSGTQAPILKTAPGEATIVVPYDLASASSTLLQAEYQGRLSPVTRLGVLAAFPSVYTADGTGKGQALATNEDGTLNTSESRAPRGSIVRILVSGLGVTSPASVTGAASTGPGAAPAGQLGVRIGGQPAEVVSAGLAPGRIGVHEIRLRVPVEAPSGAAVPLFVMLDRAESQYDLTIAIQP